MLINVHSNYSLRYGTLGPEDLIGRLQAAGHDTAVLTDINNSSAVLDFIRMGQERGFHALAGMEFRNGDKLCYIGIARNTAGFQELNELITRCHLHSTPVPPQAPELQHTFIIYPFGQSPVALRDYEFIGVKPGQLNRLRRLGSSNLSKYVMWQPVTYGDEAGYRLHRQLRAVDHNLLLSQLAPHQCAGPDEALPGPDELMAAFADFPQLIINTGRLLEACSFHFDFKAGKNLQHFGDTVYDDTALLRQQTMEGLKNRYGAGHREALSRVKRELAIIAELRFAAYFLISWDIVRFAKSRGFHHVGRGSGANSVVAYCLGITDVCPIQLDLYFERFLNPKRKTPPDFDLDFSWRDRDTVLRYIFDTYNKCGNVALLGSMNTFQDRNIVRELGKVYGLPKGEIDALVQEPQAMAGKHEIADLILSVSKTAGDAKFPNLRSIHAGGVMISELPLTAYTALDLPPKGFPTTQFDMYTAEEIHFDKLDILSQRGIGHINECAKIILENRGVTLDVHDVEKFKQDEKVRQQLQSADTIGCFYIESPATRGLLQKLRCADYLTLVAASSIIRPGVAKSGMMREYIHRYHHPDQVSYLHPVMEEQLKETYGVMVYQEDVLKVCHHFAGLDLADGDVLRRVMSGKHRTRKHLEEITGKFFGNCRERGYPEAVTQEVWRQIESFAGYSFSKAHSASYAVESYQSLYLKAHYPLEFMTAVINNFGGYYGTRVYVKEACKAGATVHLPCVNESSHATRIKGTDLYLGFVHIQHLEGDYAHGIGLERAMNGAYQSLADFVRRTHIRLEQLILLIRIGALRFTGCTKKALLWEAHALLGKAQQREDTMALFREPAVSYALPDFPADPVEDAYDEIELLGFPVSLTEFDLLKTEYRGDAFTRELLQHVGTTVRMVGDFVTAKQVRTARGASMSFGTFLDAEQQFFDTTHFPASLAHSPFRGPGAYLLQGRVVEEFGFPGIEVERMAKLPVKPDPRSV